MVQQLHDIASLSQIIFIACCDSWIVPMQASKKMLMESDFLQSLRAFDKDHIPVPVVQRIKPYIANPEFEPNKILSVSYLPHDLHHSVWYKHGTAAGKWHSAHTMKLHSAWPRMCAGVHIRSKLNNVTITIDLNDKSFICNLWPMQASKAAYGLCCWVRAMESYDRVAKVVEPKRAKLAEAEEQLEVVMTALRGKQAKLQVSDTTRTTNFLRAVGSMAVIGIKVTL